MKQNDSLRDVKNEQAKGFLLGFTGGRGILSALILAGYNFLNRSNKQPKSDADPASFEKMDK